MSDFARRLLVTGGAGFLGSHLCERLLAAGCEVLCVDNLYTGRRMNIASLLQNTRFEFMRHDICFPLYVEVDEVYNLACPASPVHYQFDPVQTTKTSVHGSINMLGLAKRVKPKFCRRRPVRYTATRMSTLRRKAIGGTSTPPEYAPVTMKANAAPKRCFLTITGSIKCALK